MILEAGYSARDVGPLGKAGAPPFVVFRKGVELREIIRKHLGAWLGAMRQRSLLLEQRAWLGEALDLRGNGRFVFGRDRKDTFFVLVLEIVQQRILVRPSFEIALNIELSIEFVRGIASLLEAVKNKMLKGIDARRGDIPIGCQIIF